MFLKKIINKILKKKDKIQNDLMTKLDIALLHEKIFIQKGTFTQRTNFFNKGEIYLGENFSIGYKQGGGFYNGRTEIQTRSKEAIIKIGKNLATNNNIFLCANKRIEIGNDVLIGRNVVIMDHNAHGVAPNMRRSYSGTAKEVIIEDNTWIGNNVQILPGTIIGKNSVVSAGSIAKGKYPENCIIQGNPAVVIKYITEGVL